jgi:F-type H+-transporting ATPase subunit a
MGLIPGLEGPTGNINVTGALGITSFLYYITMGFRQQGIKYLKHFTGGLTGLMLPTLGILIFVVEIISNSVRPVTLSLRLYVNMFADHKIGSVFLELSPWLIPIFTIVLGLFVAFVQTFIFIMLSMVYLSETVPHDEREARLIHKNSLTHAAGALQKEGQAYTGRRGNNTGSSVSRLLSQNRATQRLRHNLERGED